MRPGIVLAVVLLFGGVYFLKHHIARSVPGSHHAPQTSHSAAR
ncbi:MAG: hypothetical protein Q3966_02240 [Neisseria sp.]|nr:hypothetical protein [Neisseria sp.]